VYVWGEVQEVRKKGARGRKPALEHTSVFILVSTGLVRVNALTFPPPEAILDDIFTML